MRIYFTLLAVFMAGTWCAFSQNTLSGTITTLDNKPLEGAHIHIQELQAVTNPNGYYEIPGLSKKEQRLVISYVGYTTVDTLISVDTNIIFDVKLAPETAVLEEVEVNNEAVVSRNTTNEQKIRTETIQKYSNATLGDALKEVAGVSALKTGGAIVKPVINGLHSSRVPVVINNVRLEDQQWGTEHAPNLDINSAGKISVIKGAGALQYGGNAVGGLVLVEPLTVLNDTLFGKSILTLDSNGRGSAFTTSVHKGNDKGWTYNLSGTIKYYGDREAPDYVISNSGNGETNFAIDGKYIGNSFDYAASYSFYDATIGIAKTMHIGTVGDLVRSINSGQPDVIEPFTYGIAAPRQEMQHHLAKLNFNKQVTDNSKLSLQYAFQFNNRKEFDIRRGEDEGLAALDLNLYTHSVNADWKSELGATTLKAGLSGSAQFNDANPLTKIRPLIPNYDKYEAGAYSIVTYPFSDSFVGEAGARYDYSRIESQKYYQKSRWTSLGYDGLFDDFIIGDFDTQWLAKPEFTYNNFSASLGVRKKIRETLDVLANVSLAMRNPNPSELFSDGLHHSNATIELGDLRLNKEQALKVSATVLKSGEVFRIEATPYMNAIRDFIYLKPTGAEYTNRGSFPVYQYVQANVVLTGIDVHTDWNISSAFSHHFNFAYVHGNNTTDDVPLIDMPPINFTNSIKYTGNCNKLFIELRSEAVLEQTRYPDYNFYTEIPVDGEFVPVLVDISTPPPGYHLLHFSSGIQKKFGKTIAALNFTINNALNTSYRDYLNRQRFYTDDIGRNFQLQLRINY
jgi:iron complex outermembrane recepter protein